MFAMGLLMSVHVHREVVFADKLDPFDA